MKRILVVEDDPALGHFFCVAAALGRDVETILVQTFQEALDRANEAFLILLDLGLPDRPKGPLDNTIQEIRARSDAAIVVVSGAEISARTVYESGADAFLPKPVDLYRLQKGIQKAEALRQTCDQIEEITESIRMAAQKLAKPDPNSNAT